MEEDVYVPIDKGNYRNHNFMVDFMLKKAHSDTMRFKFWTGMFLTQQQINKKSFNCFLIFNQYMLKKIWFNLGNRNYHRN